MTAWAEPALLVSVRPSGPLPRDGVVDGTVTVSVGGSAWATSCAVGAAGVAVTCHAPVSADATGALCEATAARYGVTLAALAASDVRTTASLVGPDGTRALVAGASVVFDHPHADAVAAPGSGWFHVSLSSVVRDRTGAVGSLVARAARRSRLSIDVGSAAAAARLRDGVTALTGGPRAGLVIANEDEAAALGWDGCPRDVDIYLVKHGAAATVVHTAAGSLAVPVAPVEGVCDTTGAGDAFAGGVLAALACGGGLEAAVAYGHHLAAAAITTLGGLVDLDRVVAVDDWLDGGLDGQGDEQLDEQLDADLR